jgi:hypothetical protein
LGAGRACKISALLAMNDAGRDPTQPHQLLARFDAIAVDESLIAERRDNACVKVGKAAFVKLQSPSLPIVGEDSEGGFAIETYTHRSGADLMKCAKASLRTISYENSCQGRFLATPRLDHEI